MKNTLQISLLCLLAILAGCSENDEPTLTRKQKDAAFQTALDELVRLKSFTEVGLSYEEYCNRLLTAKGNIDVALQHANDEAATSRINKAFGFYIVARDEWKTESSNPKEREINFPDVREHWNEGADAAGKAAEYAFADDAARAQIERREQDASLARGREEQKARELQAAAEKAQEAKDLEVDTRKKAAAAMDEELEHKRRFAPEGIGFNVKSISIATTDTLATIPPGTELKIVGQNPDGTLQIQKGDLTADVPAASITHDRDLAASFRSEDQRKQDALHQWQAQQAAAAAKAPPTPAPTE